MKTSEISIETLKQYARIDDESDDVLLEAILAAAIDYCTAYTGLTREEMEQYSDIPLAVLALCADMYDVRAFTMNGIQLNPTAQQILHSHSKNFL